MKYLAIDFGDGTTTAATFDSSWVNAQDKVTKEPEECAILPKVKEIPTVMGYSTDGSSYEVADMAISNPNYRLIENWKDKPTAKDARTTHRVRYMRDYMSRIFELVVTTNNFNASEYKVCIGVPCDWSDSDVEKYQAIAKDAGIPNVAVLRESQAAILFARKFMVSKSGEHISDDAINKGLLLIDVGSSTTDFTFVKGLKGEHCGLSLGAKYVEQIFLTEAADRAEVDYEKVANNKDSAIDMFKRHTLLVRDVKEKYFSTCNQRNRATGVPGYTINILQNGERKRIEIGNEKTWQLDGEIEDALLNDENEKSTFELKNLSEEWRQLKGRHSWREFFRLALSHVKAKWDIDDEVTLVLTGGATRMYFIEDDVKEVFGDSVPCYFGSDTMRSFSVVKGLAWAAYAQDEIDDVKGKLRSMLAPDKTDEHTPIVEIAQYVQNSVLEPCAERIASETKSKLIQLLRSQDSSVNTFNKLIQTQGCITAKLMSEALQKINDGFDSSSVLQLSSVDAITSRLHKLFGRPNVKFDRVMRNVFYWHWENAVLPIDYFSTSVITSAPDDWDAQFVGPGLIGDGQFNVAAEGIEQNLSSDLVMQLFLKDDAASDKNNPLPSDLVQLTCALTASVEKYKVCELDALAGTFSFSEEEDNDAE